MSSDTRNPTATIVDADAKTLMPPSGTEDVLRSTPGDRPVSPDGSLDPTEAVVAPPADPGEISPESRYASCGILGEGGMGVVRLCDDRLVGRRVAMKVARTAPGEEGMRQRFLREARVQGQLEHPAVVPVYDLGIDAAGAPYFTMKRVRGETLDTMLRALRDGDARPEGRYSRRRLLNAFASVCLAVQFAHARGVVHRDIKPANIMLGDFGEVYVLDWGVARVGETPEPERESGVDPVVAPMPGVAATRAGAAMGTPGYMPPEQLRGDAANIGPKSDVYALGAVLFEILTLVPLHEGETLLELTGSTLSGADARASVRAPEREVPPELEALCVAATASDPAARLSSARALHDGVERYLDGEQNAQLRAEMAAAHGRDAAARWAAGAGNVTDDLRRRVLEEVGRALALDPDQPEALHTLRGIFGTEPREVPPEVARDIEAEVDARRRMAGRTAFFAYSSMALYLPALLWLGVRDWPALVAFYLLMALASWACWAAWRGRAGGWTHTMQALWLSNAGFAVSSGMFGPLILTPTMVAVNTTAYALHLQGRRRWAAVASGCAATLIPLALELLHVVPSSYSFVPGGMLVTPRILALPPAATIVLLAATGASAVLTGALGAGDIYDALTSAERRVQMQRWQLRHLVPAARGAEKTATPPRD